MSSPSESVPSRSASSSSNVSVSAACADALRGALGPLVDFLRLLRHLPDRLLHARRRDRAAERLEGAAPPSSVLFICDGNVYRSPYAQRRLRRILPEERGGPLELRSAGFGGWDHPSPPPAVAEAERRGVDLTDHRSRVLTYDLVDATELFVVTDVAQARRLERAYGVPGERIVHLGDLDPEPIRTRTIVDPWEGDPEVVRDAYDRIDRCLERLADLLTGRAAHGGRKRGGEDRESSESRT